MHKKAPSDLVEARRHSSLTLSHGKPLSGNLEASGGQYEGAQPARAVGPSVRRSRPACSPTFPFVKFWPGSAFNALPGPARRGDQSQSRTHRTALIVPDFAFFIYDFSRITVLYACAEGVRKRAGAYLERGPGSVGRALPGHCPTSKDYPMTYPLSGTYRASLTPLRATTLRDLQAPVCIGAHVQPRSHPPLTDKPLTYGLLRTIFVFFIHINFDFLVRGVILS